MPPIKRNQKSATAPARRRLAGHAGAARTESTSPDWTEFDVGAGDDNADRRSDVREPRRRNGRIAAYAAIAIGLVAGVAGAALTLVPESEPANQAFVDTQTTDAVLSAATTGVQRLVAIDHTRLDEYHDSLGEFLTENLVDELDKNWPALSVSYEQSATTVDAQVREVGLSMLEGDHAEVLLVQDVSITRDDTAAGSTSGTYLVGMERIDGVWKLSKIPDLPA
ncbi:hypothetical protein [Dietzia alimentaria]|uniref:hypothetical protein n=1 Tax=Dietzia alimentaria TaxID=665550 RepID=UPI00029A3475|nr:hypothetical protein [Dietzia alimentaria]